MVPITSPMQLMSALDVLTTSVSPTSWEGALSRKVVPASIGVRPLVADGLAPSHARGEVQTSCSLLVASNLPSRAHGVIVDTALAREGSMPGFSAQAAEIKPRIF